MNHWSWRAMQLVKQAVTSEAGKKLAMGAAGVVGPYLSKQGLERFSTQRQKGLAVDLARQIGGQYSERTVVDGRRRYVVWKDGNPIAAFPPVEGGDLAGRYELQGFPPGLLKTPPDRTA